MARMRRAEPAVKPHTDRSCCAAHKKAQRSNQAKSAPARFTKKANRRDDECPANACCIGRYDRGLGICRTRYNSTVTIPIGTPGPLPGQWQEVGPRKRPSFGDAACRYRPSNRRSAARCTLCFESTGIMREGEMAWRKNIFRRVSGSSDGLKTSGDAVSATGGNTLTPPSPSGLSRGSIHVSVLATWLDPRDKPEDDVEGDGSACHGGRRHP